MPQHHTISYSGAFLYGSGAAMATISLLVERSPSTRVLLAAGALAIAYAVTGALVAFPTAVPVAAFPYLTALGTLLIAVLGYADGAVDGAFSLLYVWVALYSFYFYSLRTALLETAWVSAAAGLGAIVEHDTDAPFTFWLLITGTSVIGGLTIRYLVTEIRRIADRDELTGLYNRRRLQEELVRDMRRAARSGEPLSLLILDLDNFKRFNDDGGHIEGDRHLRESAQRWTRELRGADLLARFGGEEFIVLMPGTALAEAAGVADRLRGLTPNEQTASVGVVSWDGREDATSLIARADAALYQAKLAGRNRTVVEELPGYPLPAGDVAVQSPATAPPR